MPATGSSLPLTSSSGRCLTAPRDILAYLSGRIIRGIGPVLARRIVAAFGADSLEVIENHPEQLAALPGMSVKKAQAISESFRSQVGVRRLIEFLAGHHLPPELAMRVYKVYGDLAIEALQDDPYLLTEPFFSANFAQVDQFALSLEIDADDERRVEAGVLFELRHNTGNGHVFLPLHKLLPATAQLLGLDEAAIAEAVARLTENDRVVAEPVAKLTAIYLPELYLAETQVAQRLRAMAAKPLERPAGLPERMRRVAKRTGVSYAPAQEDAIEKSAYCQVLLLTGGPGTGKTTTLAGMLALLDDMGLRCTLAAPHRPCG